MVTALYCDNFGAKGGTQCQVTGGNPISDTDLARRPTPQMVADGVAFCQRHQAEVLGVEADQYQDLLRGEFEAELKRQRQTQVRVFSLNNRVNKLVRIRILGPLLSRQRLRFKNDSAGAKLLVRQLQDFPLADHDDGPDALEMAIRLMGELAAGR